QLVGDAGHVAEHHATPTDENLALVLERVERCDVGGQDLGHTAEQELDDGFRVERRRELLCGALRRLELRREVAGLTGPLSRLAGRGPRRVLGCLPAEELLALQV